MERYLCLALLLALILTMASCPAFAEKSGISKAYISILEFSSLYPNLERFRVSSDSPVFILFPYAVVRVTL